MTKVLIVTLHAVAMTFAAWLEWSIMKHSGLLWALFFGAFFLLPWATAATLALWPRSKLE